MQYKYIIFYNLMNEKVYNFNQKCADAFMCITNFVKEL